VDEEDISRWQTNALTHLLSNTDVNITSVVFNEYTPSRSKTELLRRGLEVREWAPVLYLNKQILRQQPVERNESIYSVVDKSSVTEYFIEPTIIDGWKQKIPQKAVDQIAEDADLGIRFGFGFMTGPVLTEFEYGVLSYHHGDITEYRGLPMGFWEFIHGSDKGGITVQILTEELDAGQILTIKRLDISDIQTWEEIKRRLFAESEDMLTTAVNNLMNGRREEVNQLGDLYTLPKGLPVAKFAYKNTRGHINKRVKRKTNIGS